MSIFFSVFQIEPMNKTDKAPKEVPDKNLERIEKQDQREERAKKGLPSTPGSNAPNRLINKIAVTDNKYQTGSPNHPMYKVDPELERQMAAQGVPQRAVGGRRTPKKTVNSSSKKSGASEKGEPGTGAWDEKGEPTFASSQGNRPGPL